jgi:putative membrane protein
MNKFLMFLKGAIIGLANVVPGVSGGTLAIIFNIYKRLIEAFDLLFKHPIKAILSIWEILVGILIGIFAGFLLLSYGYEAFPLATTLAFIGLLIGGIKPMFQMVKPHINLKNIFIFIVGFLLVVLLPLINSFTGIHEGWVYYLILGLLGILVAFSVVAPGISGSVILMVLGYYSHLLFMGKDIFESIIQFQFTNLPQYILPISILGISFIIGLIGSVKLTKWIMNKFEIQFYAAVLGMLIACPISILIMLHKDTPLNTFGTVEWTIGGLLLIIGFLAAFWVIKVSENEENKASK